MPVRYYLSPILGTGQRGNSFRALAQDHFQASVVRGIPCTYSALIPTLANGALRETWTLCTIDLPDFAILDADVSLGLVGRKSLLNNPPTQATDDALAKFGLVRDPSDATLLQVLRRLMKSLNPVADVAA